MNAATRLAVLAASALAAGIFSPSFAAPNKEDRKLCTEAKADVAASLLKCIASLNKRLSEIEDEPEEIEAPDDTDAKIAALESEVRAAKREAAAATEAAKMATDQTAAANVKIDALVNNATKLEAAAAEAKTAAAEAKAAASAADAKADRAGDAADIAIAKADAAAAKADTIAKMTADDDGKPSSSVMAPFTVVDDTGTAIMKVEVDDGDAVLTVGATATRTRMTAGSTGARITAVDGDRIAKMEVGSGTSAFTIADDAKGIVGIGHISTGFSGFLFLKGDKPVANLGITPGGSSAVRIYNDAGNGVFSAGSNPGEGGAGAMLMGNGDTSAIDIRSRSDAAGEVQVMDAEGQVSVALRGPMRSVQVNGEGGNVVAELRMSPNSNGGNVTLVTPAGEEVVAMGATTEGDGAICVWRHKNGQTCLGIGLPMR